MEIDFTAAISNMHIIMRGKINEFLYIYSYSDRVLTILEKSDCLNNYQFILIILYSLVFIVTAFLFSVMWTEIRG